MTDNKSSDLISMSGDDRLTAANVVEHSHVAPPAGSVPETTLPLTFFDVPWLLCPHMQRIYFYPISLTHGHIISSLRRSLSVALRHFFPFAGNLISPPPPEIPCIRFSDGDSLSFTVAESAGDFDSLCADRTRDVRELQSLVPDLPPTRVEKGTRVSPLIAFQVTTFPNKGITIGVRFRHVASDGRSFHHFMKYWASICRDDDPATAPPIPSHDRSAIDDPNGLGLIFLNEWWALRNGGPSNDSRGDISRVIVLGRSRIERLKRWIVGREQLSRTVVFSSFVVVCALVWVCLVKSKGNRKEMDEPCHFVFVADCRGRLEFPVPATYFGNCLSLCFVELKRRELVGENGIESAAKAIAKRVSELGRRGYLHGAENWVSKWNQLEESGEDIISVAGSGKLGTYEADFGFGRPIRTESVREEGSNAFSVGENRDGEIGGVELGLAMSQENMSTFDHVLEHSLFIVDAAN